MKERRWLLIIVFFAFVLRFYRLGQVPATPNWDEAAIGYNAYSLLKTGQDEYGYSWPLSFRSFDDYKAPLYVYLTIPSVAVFGLNNFSVRFLSAVCGVLTVLLVHFLVKELFPNKLINYSLVASFLLAILPWHVHFSHVAFEPNLALFLIVFGTWLFLKGREKGKFLIASAVIFSLSLYAYHSPRVFVPLLVLGLIIIFRKEIWLQRRSLFLGGALALLINLPLIRMMTSVEGQMRIRGTSVFNDLNGLLEKPEWRLLEDQKLGSIRGRYWHHPAITYFRTLAKGYLVHFDFNWLFSDKAINRHRAPQIGLLYWWQLPFLISGLYLFIKKKPFGWQMILLWLILAIIPAMPTIDIPHAIRTYNLVIPLTILSSYGLVSFWPKKRFLIGFLIASSFLFFIYQYHLELSKQFFQDWQGERQEMVEKVMEVKNDYPKIIVSTNLEKSYIFFLYYLKYDPQKYLDAGGSVSGGFASADNKLENIEFRPIDWQKDSQHRDWILVDTPQNLPNGANIIERVFFPDGREAVRIVKT